MLVLYVTIFSRLQNMCCRHIMLTLCFCDTFQERAISEIIVRVVFLKLKVPIESLYSTSNGRVQSNYNSFTVQYRYFPTCARLYCTLEQTNQKFHSTVLVEVMLQ